jgi:hypothetical protein
LAKSTAPASSASDEFHQDETRDLDPELECWPDVGEQEVMLTGAMIAGPPGFRPPMIDLIG